MDTASSGLENEADLPIFGDDETKLDSGDIQGMPLFDIADLIKVLLFLSFFVFCAFLFKKVIFGHKRTRDYRKSDSIRELAFYEIDAKSSIRIISVLGTVYVLLVSSNASVLLREIRQGEEMANLEFELGKDEIISNKNSFRTIFNKVLHRGRKDDEELLDRVGYAELEKDIEISLKSKQDRLKKF
ncbi:flagellar biosynthesis protein FliZ [Borrelia sp. BU AG58]|nr:flagellar biosynthesis protein FliZ [Borrelia sp. BU AG58]